MHPLVRDLYKRVIVVGRDYPLGLDYVRRTWKKALRNQENCPSCYSRSTGCPIILDQTKIRPVGQHADCERELRKAVARGRFMVREMIGVIQLKKYRTMKQRYGDDEEKIITGTNNANVQWLAKNIEKRNPTYFSPTASSAASPPSEEDKKR